MSMNLRAVEIPTIDRRERIPQTAIDHVVAQIAARFKPQRIILFGSYAYGKPRPESDVDLLVIMETTQSEIQQAIQILQAIDYRFGLDLIVHTPQRLSQRITWGDAFLKEITSHGKVMYESTDS